MSTGIALIILFEAILGIGIILGFMHEDKVIAWEQKTAREIRRRLCEKWLNRGDLEAVRIWTTQR